METAKKTTTKTRNKKSVLHPWLMTPLNIKTFPWRKNNLVIRFWSDLECLVVENENSIAISSVVWFLPEVGVVVEDSLGWSFLVPLLSEVDGLGVWLLEIHLGSSSGVARKISRGGKTFQGRATISKSKIFRPKKLFMEFILGILDSSQRAC